MQYMGSKSKIKDFLIPELQKIINQTDIRTYIEPFCGGANVIDKINCDTKIGYDSSKTLIALLCKARDNFEEIPKEGSREWFEKARAIYRGQLKDEMPLFLIGAIQWLGSYGTRGFPGGYAPEKDGRDYYKQRYNSLKEQVPKLKGTIFISKDYNEIEVPENSLVYCDPPYAGTKTYGYSFENKFDYEKYWNWVRKNSRKAYIICSEETFPEDFIIMKEKEKRRTVGGKNKKVVTEKIGFYSQGKMADLWKK